jgi:hypothetical protein
MLVIGRNFDGTTRYYSINRGLQSIAGCVIWLAEFRPVIFRGLRFMFLLLEYLFDVDICCHSSGAYPSYLAGFQTSFTGATIFIDQKEHPLLKLIFQIGAEPQQGFDIEPFLFIHLHDVDDMDVCR